MTPFNTPFNPAETIRVRFIRYLKRDIFDEYVEMLKKEGGQFDPRTKTWTLPADADIPDECEEVEE